MTSTICVKRQWEDHLWQGAYSTLLTLSEGLVLESPSHVNFTFGIRAILRESMESRPESSFSCIDEDAELSVCLSESGHWNDFPCNLRETICLFIF